MRIFSLISWAHGVGQARLTTTNAQERRVLDVVGKLCAEQQHDPVQVQPDQRQDRDREAGVDELRS
jgi:hypothetical protein